MTVTSGQYTAATTAALQVLNMDLDREIPHRVFFGFDIHDMANKQFTPELRQKFAAEMAKAAVDAATNTGG